MENDFTITSIIPERAIPNGEITIYCEGLALRRDTELGVFFDDVSARIVGASSERIIVCVPEGIESSRSMVRVEYGGVSSVAFPVSVGRRFVSEMHIVANPAVDPSDGSVIVTRSGSRGQELPVTLFRVDEDGFVSELPAAVKNPTGIAFDSSGDLYVSNRADGEVYRIGKDGTAALFASGLGVATGIAFDEKNTLYVGDRGGTIYRVSGFGLPEPFATLEPSVAAYHLAFGPDGRLFVTAPGLASNDCVYAIDRAGFEVRYFKGLGRPQGLAFDRQGNLFVAACYKGRRGVVRIGDDGESCEHYVAGSGVVGLCFDRDGNLLVATNESVYRFES